MSQTFEQKCYFLFWRKPYKGLWVLLPSERKEKMLDSMLRSYFKSVFWGRRLLYDSTEIMTVKSPAKGRGHVVGMSAFLSDSVRKALLKISEDD